MTNHTQLADIRRFLMEFFDDNELRLLTSESFRAVYNDFTTGMSKTQMVERLVEYSYRHGRMPDLLAVLEEKRPLLYPQYFPEEIDASLPPPLSSRFPRTRAVWAGALLLVLLAVLAIIFWPEPSGRGDEFTPSPTATPGDEAAAGNNTAVAANQESLQSSSTEHVGAFEGAIGLNETVSGVAHLGITNIYTFTAGPTQIDVTLTMSRPTADATLLLFDPEFNDTLYEYNVLDAGRGEVGTYINMGDERPYQIAVEVSGTEEADYTLTVTESERPSITIGDVKTGTLIGFNPAIFTFSEGPATLTIMLEANVGDPEVWLADANGSVIYTNTPEGDGRIARLDNIALPDAGPYEIGGHILNTPFPERAYTLTVTAGAIAHLPQEDARQPAPFMIRQ